MCLSSSSTFLSPATENGWHGYPHERMSWSGTFLSGSFANSFTSLAIGTFGKFFASILRHHSSVSQNMMVLDSSAQENPKLKPPMPLHKSTCLSIIGSCEFYRLLYVSICQTTIIIKISTKHICLISIKPSDIFQTFRKLWIIKYFL